VTRSLSIAIVGLAALFNSAAADDKKPDKKPGASDDELARMLFKKGIEEYKAKKYEVAAQTLAKSYELAPKPDSLFALAQAERLAGKCDLARPHYKRLLEVTTDLSTSKAVQANLELCALPPEPETQDGDKPVEVVPVGPPPDPPKPTVITQVVTRTEHKGNWLATTAFVGGGFAIGTSLALFLISRSTAEDSDNALTLDASNQLYDRSKTERSLSIVSGSIGIALVGFGVYRVIAAKTRTRTEVAAVPLHGGGSFWVSTRF
jgi:tetratricopeptide (TPR) repeat protein